MKGITNMETSIKQNRERKARALKALRSAQYADKLNLHRENIVDLLTDIRHLIAMRDDLDFDDMVESSSSHFNAEKID